MAGEVRTRNLNLLFAPTHFSSASPPIAAKMTAEGSGTAAYLPPPTVL